MPRPTAAPGPPCGSCWKKRSRPPAQHSINGIQVNVAVPLEKAVSVDRVDCVRLVSRALEYRVHGAPRQIGHVSDDEIVRSYETGHIDEAVLIGIGDGHLRGIA